MHRPLLQVDIRAAKAEAQLRRRARIRLVVLLGCVAYVIAIASVPGLVSYSPLVCGTHRLLGLYCPGCGLSRAFACMARLQPLEALRFNPLIVIAAPSAVVVLCDSFLECFCQPGLVQRIPQWLRSIATGLFLFGTITIFFLRFVSWVLPTWNPDGWGLPPAIFPPT